MTWTVRMVPPDRLTPEVLYDINKRHGLLHDDLTVTIPGLMTMANTAQVFVAYMGDLQVATAIISRVVPGVSAEFDLIPVAKYFRGRWKNDLRAAMEPLLENLLSRQHVRRITAYVPASRSRAIKALDALGFKKEGEMRKAVQLEGKEPEGLVILGLLEE
jgi:hypothetical protein